MISTQGLADELSDAGKLLGLLQDDGNLNAGWFGDPLGNLNSILGTPTQRAALLRLLDALMPPAALDGIPAGEKWHPILGALLDGNLYITAKDTGGGVTFGMGGEFGGPTARLRAQVDLVHGNSGVHAQAGPLRVQLRVQLGFRQPAQSIGLDAISVTATIAPSDVSVVVRLEKLQLGDGPVRDTILDPANLDAEATQLILGLVQQALHDSTAAAGTEAGAVAKHLLPLLGLGDPAIPVFPFGDLSKLQDWLRTLPVSNWLPHLAGLMGVDGALVFGSGSEADPWAVSLVAFDAQSRLSFTVAQPAGRLVLGLRAMARGSAGALQAQANLASIPLNGTAPATVLPSASFLFVNSPGAVATTLRAGVAWDGQTLRPLLELLDATVAGTHYDKIDLTNTEGVAGVGLQAVILGALGNGAGGHLAALAMLVPPASDPGSPHIVNVQNFIANPSRAIAQEHRAALLDPLHNWSALLAEVGGLLGLPGAVTGTGTRSDPWRIPFGPTSPVGVELVAFNAQTSGNSADPQKLRLGVRASAASFPIRFSWIAELLAFDLPQSGDGATALMAGQHATFVVQPGPALQSAEGFTLSANSFEADLDWSPGSSVRWEAGVNNLSVTANGTTVNVAALKFPAAAGFDVSNPAATAASLGVSIPQFELLIRLMVSKAALSWGRMPGWVVAGLLGVNNSLSGFQPDWPVLSSFIPDPFPALRTWLGHVAVDVSADGTPFLHVLLNWLGALLGGALPNEPGTTPATSLPAGFGTYETPWVLPLGAGPAADALVWLEPSGPPVAWATGIGARLDAVTNFNALLTNTQELSAFVPDVANAFSDVDTAALADALAQIASYLSSSDGVVPIASQLPTGSTWTHGTPINAAHSQQPKEPTAIAQIKAQIDSLAGGAAGARAVLLLGPSFSNHVIWSDLLGASPTANFDLRANAADPSAVVDYYTANLSDASDQVSQIARVVARIATLRPGVPVTLVAHSTAGLAARAFTAANPVQVKGLITLGTPHSGAELPFLTSPAFAQGVRLIQGLRTGMTAGPIRDAIDHMTRALDGYLPPPAPGELPIPAPYPAAAFTGSATADTGGRPALALGGTIPGDLLDSLRQAASALSTQAAAAARPAPTHIAFGARAHLPFPTAPAGEVNADASLRADMFRVKLRDAVAEPARPARGLGVRVYLNRPGDWLTPNVRTAEFGVDIAPTATPFVRLHQVAARAPMVLRMTLADASAQAVLGEIMQAISNPAPPAVSSTGALLSALQSLGVTVVDPHGGIGFSADAFAAITTDVAGFFGSRLAPALAGGVAGLNAPVTLGSLPLEVAVTAGSITIRTAPRLPLNGNALLTFDTSTLSASFNIGAWSLTWAAGNLSVQAQPWLAPVALPPDAATLTSVLNDALPRLLFSSAAGAMLEAIVGPSFTVGPLDSFFSDTGNFMAHSLGAGDGSGGIDGSKLNQLLTTLSALANFPPGPGFTLPAELQLTASGHDPAVVQLATTAPIGGVLAFALTASIDKLRHVTPGGTITLNTPLTGTWPAVAITFGVTPTGISLAVAPQGITPIQILPSFSGFGSLGAAAAALLPQALDDLVTALAPAPAWLTNVLALAQTLGLYDPVGHFTAHTAHLRALLAENWLSLFDPSKRGSVASTAAALLNSFGGLPGTAAASGPTVNWSFSLAGADAGTVGIALGWDGSGPLATLSTTNLKLGSGAIEINLTAGYAGGTLQAHTDWSVPLQSALNLDLAPKLDVSVAGGAFRVNVYPLAAHGDDGPLAVSLAPAVGVHTNTGTPEQLVRHLLLPLVTDVLFQATKSHLHDQLWAGGKTLKDALVAAQIITPAEVLKTPVPDVFAIISGLLTGFAGINIPVTSTLKLALTSAGTRFGVGLSGHQDFVAGNFTVSARFGAPADWDVGADAGLVLKLIDTGGGTVSFNPGLSVAGLGLGLTGVEDAPLVNLSGFRLGGFRGYVFFDSEFKSGPLLSGFGAGLELDAFGLPLGLATGGNLGGNNPVAASLLRSDGGNSGDTHPVNPAIDIAAWAWRRPFKIKFGGQDGILWIGVHRTFGPIHIDQVGLEIGDHSVALLIDGSVKVAGLLAQAHELSVDVPYDAIATPARWSLDLKGLAISFQAPGVTLTGALMKSDGQPVEYDGLLMIQITQFGFIAVGAYSTPTDPATHDAYTSMFVFAGVFVVIGLPPIIEITGLGFGIGYNRELIVPSDMEQIPDFLLVKVLDRPDKIADDPMGALMSIRDQMPARRGSFWLAAGLRGTSFVVVHVTAVVYVALDRGLEIGILGVARMALPSDDTALVSVELALKVRFSSAESLFSIQAQLTSNSYLLNRDCQLTGGFAYFMWFAKSQFLLTMGGYHPAFHKEPEYPDVPRLGYHWSFLGVVNIKGESYFALTNTCVMAGTRFEATYGPDWLQVWFTAYTDFLLSWDPFYYDIAIGISVGARFRIHICFFGCVTISISVSLGASLRILGPPLHGEVTVDLAVASVTVSFGPDPRPDKLTIPWNAFVSKYLHAEQPGNEAALAHVLTGLLPPEPAGGQPSPGTQAQPWKMSSEWSFQTETRMPAMEFSFQTEFDRSEGEWLTRVFGHYSNLSTVYKFDIAPMGVDQAHHKLTSKHKVVIAAWDDQGKRWVQMVPADSPALPEDDRFILDARRFRMEPVFSQISEATYHLLPHDDVPAAARTLPAVTGIKITGVAILEDESAVISIAKLFDYGFSRPLPFATLSTVLLKSLKTLGVAAELLSLAAVSASTDKTTAVAHEMLTGGGFFSQARADAGLDPSGLHPLAARALTKFRSSPPLLTPITTGLTMKPVGLNPPPDIRKVPPVEPVVLTKPRLRAVVQGRPTPVMDVPPILHTTVSKVARAGVLRLAPPKLDTVTGARLHFVRAANAPSPTQLARSTRTLRSFQFGWSAGGAHTQAFNEAEDRISGDGVVVPAGTTHVWDVPLRPKHTVEVSGRAVGRVTSLSRSGLPLNDRELSQGAFVLPDGCAMLAVTCLGHASNDSVAGWQTGNLMQQVGSNSLLGRRSLVVLPQAATTVKSKQASAQAMIRMSDAMADQPGVETWLPISTEVVGLILDLQDLCSAADGDLAIAATGAEIASPPVRVVGGRRKMLLYDVVKRDDTATHIIVSVASKNGARMAGVVGLAGRAREWGNRMNGGVPEQFVPDGASTPDGEVLVRIRAEDPATGGRR
jgi:hypothetical protein